MKQCRHIRKSKKGKIFKAGRRMAMLRKKKNLISIPDEYLSDLKDYAKKTKDSHAVNIINTEIKRRKKEEPERELNVYDEEYEWVS